MLADTGVFALGDKIAMQAAQAADMSGRGETHRPRLYFRSNALQNGRLTLEQLAHCAGCAAGAAFLARRHHLASFIRFDSFIEQQATETVDTPVRVFGEASTQQVV